MTPQEQDMIGGLIDRVQKTQLSEKDVDAEQMLQQGLGRNPDALYVLAQTVLVQKYALEQAQVQLTQAKQQVEQMQQHPEPKHATSFLGSLLGRNENPAPPPPPPQGYAPQGYQPVPAYPQYAPVSGYGPPAGGGFLQNAMQTAAGVAAGALAFEGIESLMHGFGHAGGYGQGFGGFGGEGQRPEEVVNNYYGDDRGERGGHENRDYGSLDSKNERDTSYGSGDNVASSRDDSGFNSNASLDETSFNDSGSDFDDGGSGGGDDGSFA